MMSPTDGRRWALENEVIKPDGNFARIKISNTTLAIGVPGDRSNIGGDRTTSTQPVVTVVYSIIAAFSVEVR